MRVPFVDLAGQAKEIEESVFERIRGLVGRGQFAGGPIVEEFERAFAAYCDVDHCVALGSGTAALEEVLRALDFSADDEVVLPANTFIAAAEAVARAGARPVLADVELTTANLTAKTVEPVLSEKTKGVLATHLYGQPAEMDELQDLCQSRGILLMEDAAQAQGARWNGKPTGGLSHVAGFSFYPSKNLGAWGEAGCVTTNEQELAEKIRALRNHGSTRRYHHEWLGTNQRMDGIQAAVLLSSLERLDAWNQQRQALACTYQQALDAMGVDFIHQAPGAISVYHLFVIRVSDRDAVAADLQNHGIATGIHYPIPVHLQPAFQFLGYQAGDFPHSEQLAGEILSLPMFPQMTGVQQKHVLRALQGCISRQQDD